jgi:hypothetical protein
MNARLIINDREVLLGHRHLEEFVFTLNDEPAMREIFHELAKSPASEIRKDIAGNQYLFEETRRRLIADTSLEVMRAIIISDEAQELMTKSDLERYLATGDVEVIRPMALNLKAFTREYKVCDLNWLCENLVRQPDPATRYNLAANIDTPVSFLKKLAGDDDVDVARKAAETLREVGNGFDPDDYE